MNEQLKCEQFLKANGYRFIGNDNGDEWWSYAKDGAYGVDLGNREIVFLDDSGDFLHLPINYYTLVGALIELRQIGCVYISTKASQEARQ